MLKDADSISGVASATQQRLSGFLTRSPLPLASLTTRRFAVEHFSFSSLTSRERPGNCYCGLLEGALFEATRHFTGSKSVTQTFSSLKFLSTDKMSYLESVTVL